MCGTGHPCYRSSRPVWDGCGETTVLRCGLLLKSEHPEVREAAQRGEAFEFGGVQFEPIQCPAEPETDAKSAAPKKSAGRRLGSKPRENVQQPQPNHRAG